MKKSVTVRLTVARKNDMRHVTACNQLIRSYAAESELSDSNQFFAQSHKTAIGLYLLFRNSGLQKKDTEQVK